MKVVINRCHGGFGLSAKAIKWLHQKRSDLIKEYAPDSDYYKSKMDFFGKLSSRKKTDLGDGYTAITALTDTVMFNGNMLTTTEYDMNTEDFRTHRDTVAVVEALGSKEASGMCAELKVVEIPNYIQFQIEEYDGSEWIAEKHNTWR